MKKSRTWVSWSSGKDSAFALHLLRSDPTIEVCGLLTTVILSTKRVAMHSVREELLDRQASALGLPLHKIYIPADCPNDIYELRMRSAVEAAESQSVQQIAFGDLYLQDIRDYREKMLSATNLTAVFPLWQRDTTKLAREILGSGIRALLTCIDLKKVPSGLIAREFDDALLRDLPSGVDPCGENGEFHTFVFDAPGFSNAIPIERGQTYENGQFRFVDVRRVQNGIKQCSLCGVRLVCGARSENTECWCMGFPRLAKLPADAVDCLCPECLKKEIDAAVPAN